MDKNKFEEMAAAARVSAELGEIDPEIAAKDIHVYEFLATCDKHDIRLLYGNTSSHLIAKAVLGAVLDDLAKENVINNEQKHIIYATYTLLGKIDPKNKAKDSRINEFLESCDQDDVFIMYASGAFNAFSKQYLEIILDELISESIIDENQKKVIKKVFSFRLGEAKFLH